MMIKIENDTKHTTTNTTYTHTNTQSTTKRLKEISEQVFLSRTDLNCLLVPTGDMVGFYWRLAGDGV
jgi:hypothetical protein